MYPNEQGSEAGSMWRVQGWLSRGMLQPLGAYEQTTGCSEGCFPLLLITLRQASDVQGLSSYLLIPCHGVSQLTALRAVCYYVTATFLVPHPTVPAMKALGRSPPLAAGSLGGRGTGPRPSVQLYMKALITPRTPQGVNSQLISPALSRCRGSEIPILFLFLPRAYETQLAVLLRMFSCCCSWHADESLCYASAWGKLS